jgi:anti-anti-sigma regulatory factor
MEDVMAANFKILVHHSSESLHLKLAGDFDGTSAYEVINTMLENGRTHRIFIHTAGLKEIHPFGKAILEKNLFMFKKQDIEVIFTGEHASQFVPVLA